jgi:uncharacterized protein YndB with AHSA1/START domain
MKNDPIVIERIFNAPVERVWKAITDKKEMKHWYFDLSEFRPETGFEFSFKGGTDEKVYVHLCKITEVIPFKKISYTWRYEGYEGNSHVIFELFEEGDKTRLRLTHEGLETFPETNADLAKENFIEGWNQIIGNSLQNYLEKL